MKVLLWSDTTKKLTENQTCYLQVKSDGMPLTAEETLTHTVIAGTNSLNNNSTGYSLFHAEVPEHVMTLLDTQRTDHLSDVLDADLDAPEIISLSLTPLQVKGISLGTQYVVKNHQVITLGTPDVAFMTSLKSTINTPVPTKDVPITEEPTTSDTLVESAETPEEDASMETSVEAAAAPVTEPAKKLPETKVLPNGDVITIPPASSDDVSPSEYLGEYDRDGMHFKIKFNMTYKNEWVNNAWTTRVLQGIQTMVSITEPAKHTKPHDIILILDTSGSMSSTLTQLQQAVTEVAKKMQPNDTLSVISFNSYAKIILNKCVVPSEIPFEQTSAVKMALSEIRTEINQFGGTMMQKGFDELVKIPKRDKETTSIIFLTDGQASDGSRADFLRNSVCRSFRDRIVPVYTVGLTTETNNELITNLACTTGGYPVFSRSGDTLNAKLHELFTAIFKPNTPCALIGIRNAASTFGTTRIITARSPLDEPRTHLLPSMHLVMGDYVLICQFDDEVLELPFTIYPDKVLERNADLFLLDLKSQFTTYTSYDMQRYKAQIHDAVGQLIRHCNESRRLSTERGEEPHAGTMEFLKELERFQAAAEEGARREIAYTHITAQQTGVAASNGPAAQPIPAVGFFFQRPPLSIPAAAPTITTPDGGAAAGAPVYPRIS